MDTVEQVKAMMDSIVEATTPAETVQVSVTQALAIWVTLPGCGRREFKEWANRRAAFYDNEKSDGPYVNAEKQQLKIDRAERKAFAKAKKVVK